MSWEDFATAAAVLNSAVDDVILAADVLEDVDSEQAGTALAWLRTERKRLADVEAAVESLCVRTMEQTDEWQRDLSNGHRIVRHGGKKRKAWRHDDLFAVVLDRARSQRIANPETGDVESEGEAALRLVKDAASVNYWRVGVLKGWGLAVDEFCTVEKGRATVEVL